MSGPAAARKVIEIKPWADPEAKVYPRSISGIYARWRWIFVWLTQIVFYGLCWLPWRDRQAILFDIDARKFYFFDLVLWPQDTIYLVLLMIIGALALFLFTAVAGRLWCGYACPQTVYTEIFLWFEKLIEGERPQRIKLDAAPWSPRKLAIKSAKHAIWIVFSAMDRLHLRRLFHADPRAGP
jgi:polyferredoxin